MIDSGKIKARSKWKEVYPLFSSDKRYLVMLGNPGSNPLELFWDSVDDLDQKLDKKISTAKAAIAAWEERVGPPSDGKTLVDGIPLPFKITSETTKEHFLKVVKSDREEAAQNLSAEDLDEIFKTVCSASMFTSIRVDNATVDVFRGGQATSRRKAAC